MTFCGVMVYVGEYDSIVQVPGVSYGYSMIVSLLASLLAGGASLSVFLGGFLSSKPSHARSTASIAPIVDPFEATTPVTRQRPPTATGLARPTTSRTRPAPLSESSVSLWLRWPCFLAHSSNFRELKKEIVRTKRGWVGRVKAENATKFLNHCCCHWKLHFGHFAAISTVCTLFLLVQHLTVLIYEHIDLLDVQTSTNKSFNCPSFTCLSAKGSSFWSVCVFSSGLIFHIISDKCEWNTVKPYVYTRKDAEVAPHAKCCDIHVLWKSVCISCLYKTLKTWIKGLQ